MPKPKKKIIRLLKEAEEKQSKGNVSGMLPSVASSTEAIKNQLEKGTAESIGSDSRVEGLELKATQPNINNLTGYSCESSITIQKSDVDHNQNEPGFFSRHKWEIAIGVGIGVALIILPALWVTTNLPALAIIGIAALSGLIVDCIAGGVAYMISKPSTEIEKVVENNLEQHIPAVPYPG